MIYGFDTDDPAAATGALLLYAVYRSRSRTRWKVTPGMWGQIERAVKSAAKRADSLPRFLESLKPRLACETIHPRWMRAGMRGTVALGELPDGSVVGLADGADGREFMVRLIEQADGRATLTTLYRETAFVVLLVRDRIEREKPLLARFAGAASEDEAPE